MADFSEQTELSINLTDLELIESVESEQALRLFRHRQLGKVLVINGEVQHVEAWQPLYHEPLVHLGAAFVEAVSDSLILGGGSLFAAAEILRYPTIQKCVLVDHDPEVIALMARHYPHAQKVLDDPRFEFVEGDALAYLKIGRKYDLLINDALDLQHVHEEQVYLELKKSLTERGVCADVIYRHFFDQVHLRATRTALVNVGPIALSMISVPEYPGCLHALTVWGGNHIRQDLRQPLNKVQLEWISSGCPSDMQFYDPQFLGFHLYVPPILKQQWDRSIQ